MNLNNEQIKTYNEQIKEQSEALDNFKIYSPGWYDTLDQILQAKLGLKELEEENVNLQNSINQLKFDRFDDLRDKLSDITDEADFLISLLDSDNFFDNNGKITDDGLTAMGLSAMNYDTYMAQADQYKQWQQEVQDMYDAGLIGYEEYTSKMREYQQGQQDSIKSAYDCRDAVISYVEQGLKAQNDALAESIDKQKELLRSEKDLYDFQKKINDQNKNIANLKKQISSLESDDSEENRKKLQQLKSDLAKAEEEQKDTLFDRSISDQEDALDEMLENSMSAAEEYLSDSERVFMDSLNYVNSHTEQVSQNLERISQKLGFEISDNIANAWEGAGNAVDTYENILQGNVPGITSQIGQITQAWEEAAEAAEDAAEKIVNATVKSADVNDSSDNPGNANNSNNNNNNSNNNKNNSSTTKPGTTKPETPKKSESEWGSWFINKKFTGDKKALNKNSSIVDRLKYNDFDSSESARAKYYKAMGRKDKYTGSASQNAWMLEQMKKHGFSTGGTIGKAINQSGEDGFILARTGEEVLSIEKIKELGKSFQMINPVLDNLKTMIPTNQIVPRQQPMEVHIDNSITVDGVATDQIVKDMEKVAQKQAENTIAKINSLTYSKGVRYK